MKKILLPLILLLLIPALAFSHAGILNSTPPKNGIVTAPLEKITIKLGASVEPAFSKAEVFDPDDNKVSAKTTFLKDNRVMESELKKNLAPGVYTVKWKFLSMDGHTVKGKYSFTIE
jgi:methionine-rich copper-binding protein CopC